MAHHFFNFCWIPPRGNKRGVILAKEFGYKTSRESAGSVQYDGSLVIHGFSRFAKCGRREYREPPDSAMASGAMSG
jgi:hypothetical protein